jgi:holo-[acyl-carrier protein] synthase
MTQNMNIDGVGIDIVEVSRFEELIGKEEPHLISKLFTPHEQEYCFSFKNPAVHFAGTFAAKEAAHKACGDRSVALESIEVRRLETGKPEIWIKGSRSNSLLVSISHTDDTACAISYFRSI